MSCVGRSDSVVASYARDCVPVVQRIQKPWRRPREVECQMWWRPGGRSFIPAKVVVEVKETRSRPTCRPEGREVRRRVVVEAGGDIGVGWWGDEPLAS